MRCTNIVIVLSCRWLQFPSSLSSLGVSIAIAPPDQEWTRHRRGAGGTGCEHDAPRGAGCEPRVSRRWMWAGTTTVPTVDDASGPGTILVQICY